MSYNQAINGYFLFGWATKQKYGLMNQPFTNNKHLIELSWEFLEKEKKDLWKDRAKSLRYTEEGQEYILLNKRYHTHWHYAPAEKKPNLENKRHQALLKLLKLVKDLPV